MDRQSGGSGGWHGWALSPVQKGLLLHQGDGGTAYVDQMICRLSGELDVPVARRTLDTLIGRHDALRCRFTDGLARQEFPARAPAKPAFRDLRAARDPRALVERFAAYDVTRGLDLPAQTSRCHLFRLSATEHVLVWTYHHAIADSWTLRLLQDEFCEIYRRGTAPDPKAPSITSYLDWVGAQDQAKARTFWRDHLARYRPRPERRASGLHRAAPSAATEVRLGAAVRADVEAARRACKATANAVILAAWGVCALDLSQRRACLIGCVTAGRGVPVDGIERMAGALANTVPAVVCAGTALGDLVRRLRDHAFAASRHSYLSLGDIMACAGLRPADLHSVVNFTLDREEVKTEGLPFTIPVVRYHDQATFPAYCDVEVERDDVRIRVRYDPDTRFFCGATIRRKFALVLRSLLENPGGSVGDLLDAMTAEEFTAGEAPLSF
ncbi:condensation domain-containing protein [Nonomuraea lactucae]|uniref:condensation domain-containing protein n=1 Tax=Nonomuraea lactucae TaxID=2249762 RepID=UPI0013B3F16E|nr:condensation domain-containing protein [Nonomuraea lactucae]